MLWAHRSGRRAGDWLAGSATRAAAERRPPSARCVSRISTTPRAYWHRMSCGELLEPVPGKRATSSGPLFCRQSDGLPDRRVVSLQAGLAADRVLRMSIEIPDWGTPIASSVLDGRPRHRAAVLSRANADVDGLRGDAERQEPKPETYAHWGCDSGRYTRSKGGTVEIRFQDGNLVLQPRRSAADVRAVRGSARGSLSRRDGGGARAGHASLGADAAGDSAGPAGGAQSRAAGETGVEAHPGPRAKSGASLKELPDGGIELAHRSTADWRGPSGSTLSAGTL